MNVSLLTSKICLSLKHLNNIDFNYLSSLVHTIELRLDTINIREVDLELLSTYFNNVILKLKNFDDLFEIQSIYSNQKLLNKIIYDLDYYEYINNINNFDFISNNSIYILSIHDINYNNITKYLDYIYQLDIFNYLKYIKIVIGSLITKYSKNLLVDIYNNHINIADKIICFIEGEDYTSSRYHSLLLGSPLFYCAIDKYSRTGKGQPTLDEAIRIINLLGSSCQNINSNK